MKKKEVKHISVWLFTIIGLQKHQQNSMIFPAMKTYQDDRQPVLQVRGGFSAMSCSREMVRVTRYNGQEIYMLQDWQEGVELESRGTMSRDCLDGMRRKKDNFPGLYETES